LHGLGAGLADQYLDALSLEAQYRRARFAQPVHSIFIGGGTPTMLTGNQLRRLWYEVIALFPRIPEAEISIEANPGTFNDDVLAALAELPLTRVSLGVQSIHTDELAMLGRIHTPEHVPEAVKALRSIGIPQINLDLMYALPGQSAARWRETLRQILSLQPDHISMYALILEDGTPLAEQVAAGVLPQPVEEEEEAMSRISASELATAGYSRYEVSNAARPGAVCRHNLGYWLGRDYLGLGVAAASTVSGVRWKNEEQIRRYITRINESNSAVTYVERLSAKERLLERVMLGLRLEQGFDLRHAETECDCRLMDLAGDEVATLQDEGFISLSHHTLKLTAKGYPLANMITTRLMLAGEKRYIAG
jgi:oxygen-independent coproporphyrinogen-3 oxidase